MRNRLILIAFLLLMGGWPAYSQQVTGNITAVDTSGACTTANGYVAVHLLSNAGSVSFVVTGTFGATLNPLVSVDGTHFKAASAYPTNSSTPVTSMTAAGTWTVGVAGMVTFCVDASAYASGTATITIRPSNAVSISAITGGGGGGGGSGTVTEVDTTAPLSGGPITGSGTIACATCAIGPGSSTANHIAEFASTDGLTLKDGGAASNGISGQASGVIPLGSTATTIGAQSHCDDGVTTSATVTCTEPITSTGAITAGGSGAGALILPQGTANGHAGTTQITLEAPASVTSYERIFAGAAATGFYLGTNASGVVTDSQVSSTGSGNVVLATSPTLVTPALGTPSALVLTNATSLPCGAMPALTGDTTSSATSCATTTSKINGTSLAGLASGLLYNTTSTGVPSIATDSQVNTTVKGLTGCNTATYVYTPQAADCVAPSGGSAGTYYQTQGYNSTPIAATANTLSCGGVVIPPGGLSVGHIAVNVGTGDGSNNSDIGFYNSSGTLLAHVGAQHISSTGSVDLAFSGGTQTISAGKGYFCYTSVASTFALGPNVSTQDFYTIQSTGISTTGGALPSTITPPSDNPALASNAPAFILYP